MTLRDLYNLTAAARGHWVVCGTPETIADTLEEWFVEGAADGYNVLPPYFPGAFDDFVDLVVPELQRRGLFRRDYEGTTLRDHFGLPRISAPAAPRSGGWRGVAAAQRAVTSPHPGKLGRSRSYQLRAVTATAARAPTCGSEPDGGT